jgi:Predicted transcriptional regulator
VAAGLLDAEFRRLTGRSGPGAGRPSKLYRRSAREIEVSLPERRYRLAASWLAEAFGRDDPADALHTLAHLHGEQLGSEARLAAGQDPSPAELLDAGVARLNHEGFDARRQMARSGSKTARSMRSRASIVTSSAAR